MKSKLTLLVIAPHTTAAQNYLLKRHCGVFDLKDIYNIKYVSKEQDILGHKNDHVRVLYVPGWFKLKEASRISYQIKLRQFKTINN